MRFHVTMFSYQFSSIYFWIRIKENLYIARVTVIFKSNLLNFASQLMLKDFLLWKIKKKITLIFVPGWFPVTTVCWTAFQLLTHLTFVFNLVFFHKLTNSFFTLPLNMIQLLKANRIFLHSNSTLASVTCLWVTLEKKL